MTGTSRKLISLVVPVYNEEENVQPLYEAVCRIWEGISDRYDYEFIFTDNHSTDATFSLLSAIAKQDGRVRVIRFSRNFGYQRSILTGFMHARGDAAIQLDCDMQDPPALIPEFVRLWEEGSQVVYGVRRSRKEAWWINGIRKLFYRFINALSEDKLPLDAGDFRLIDRQVLDELRKYEDHQPYLRGTIAAMGFTQQGYRYDRAERKRGHTKFKWSELISLAVDGILNHSVIPLRLATYTGLAVSLLTFLGIIVYVSGKLIFRQNWPAGFATTTILILLSLSLNALFLGIIGEYLGRIYLQVKKRPLTIIERTVNCNKAL